jgi:hypothetical protein
MGRTNVTLSNVAVDEGTFTGSSTMSAPTCPAGVLSVAPEAQVTCTATYVLTQADIDAGQLTNDATATGTTPQGASIDSNISEVTIPAVQTPADTLLKTVDSTTVTAAGQALTYTFTFTNTGNVSLTDVVIDEGAFSGTGTLSAVECPGAASSVLPGAIVVCHASYVVTAADLEAGTLTNTATASATPAGGGNPIATDPSTAVVPAALPTTPLPTPTTTTIPPTTPATPPAAGPSSVAVIKTLAVTGGEIGISFLTGVALVGAGVLVLGSRRRRTQDPHTSTEGTDTF